MKKLKTADKAPSAPPSVLARDLSVYLASDFFVVDGVNVGDNLADCNELCLDDTYKISQEALRQTLRITDSANDPMIITQESEVGNEGYYLCLDGLITLMSQSGITTEALIFAEVNPADHTLATVYLMPLAPLSSECEYCLMDIDRDGADTRLAEATCASFVRGTQITLADGRQIAVEDLSIGDRVLTRDNGPQPIRWIGSRTTRAAGDFAPITIKPGVLSNANELSLAANHRLLVYQHQDILNVGRSEVLVRAGDLVNNDTIVVQEGGYVDYFRILFDDHQIIYAEGMAAESLSATRRTAPALPNDIADAFVYSFEEQTEHRHNQLEIKRAELPDEGALTRLRSATER
ncbi:Hint domain-containing protein [Falsihalocynthiibacter sp. SS001]|uniref:Hint domain-containing protein n=1 Tax=Falsihalocynthiibacter sp. SS001 TaxID=3349698 RepID=UPI0036D27927